MHTFAWACVLQLKLSVATCFLYVSIAYNRSQYNLCYCLPYACSTSKVIFMSNLKIKVTPEHTLHSRVKDSIPQNSIILFCSNSKGWLIC